MRKGKKRKTLSFEHIFGLTNNSASSDTFLSISIRRFSINIFKIRDFAKTATKKNTNFPLKVYKKKNVKASQFPRIFNWKIKIIFSTVELYKFILAAMLSAPNIDHITKH